MPQQRRRKSKNLTYRLIMGNECANPDCEDGMDHEAHHIVPLSKGGEDAYWNLVCLCRSCHHGLGLHRSFEDVELMLYTWKCYHELSKLGFVLDDTDEDFNEKKIEAIKKAILR